MSAKISLKNTYILVKPQAVDYWEIMETLSTLFEMPEYLEKNTIWDFPDERIRVTYDQLYRIRDVLEQHFPKSSKQHNKTAIVVKSGLQNSMADYYAKIVKDLPFEARVFSDVQSAEVWIAQT